MNKAEDLLVEEYTLKQNFKAFNRKIAAALERCQTAHTPKGGSPYDPPPATCLKKTIELVRKEGGWAYDLGAELDANDACPDCREAWHLIEQRKATRATLGKVRRRMTLLAKKLRGVL